MRFSLRQHSLLSPSALHSGKYTCSGSLHSKAPLSGWMKTNMGSSKSRTGLIATSFAALAFIFVLIAFVTPYWLETDGQLEKPKFLRIGLWQVCFSDFEDPRHYYDTQFYSCWWVFEEEYYIIHDILLPGFFVATQFFFTLCFTLLLISTFLVTLYVCCHKDHTRYVLLLLVIGSCLIIAAVSGTIAIIIFGAMGDSRVWMPNWEHNDISWSYALAVLGTVFLYVSGILYLVEGRVTNMKRKMADQDQSEGGYHMETRKTSQTTI